MRMRIREVREIKEDKNERNLPYYPENEVEPKISYEEANNFVMDLYMNDFSKDKN